MAERRSLRYTHDVIVPFPFSEVLYPDVFLRGCSYDVIVVIMQMYALSFSLEQCKKQDVH